MSIEIGRPSLALLLFALAACAAGSIQVPDDALVITNGTVIDGIGRAPIIDGVVVVHGDRILAVGEAADFEIPESARLLDAGGGSVLPGIINSHTHSTGDPVVRREFLIDGVTTVCNLGTALDRLSRFEEASTPEGPAARGYWAGPIITAPGGYPGPVYGFQFNYEVATPAEARAAVTDLLDRGASMIKITLAPGNPRDPWPILDLERVQAIVEEAHARGVLVRAHVFEPYIVEDIVLPAGIDVIEHSPLPILSPEEESSVLESDDPRAQLYDVVAPEFERLLARVVKQGIAMVPTLDAQLGTLFRKPDRSPLEQIVVDVHVEAVHRFRALGGIVAVGNDYGGNPDVESGMSLTEMKLLLVAGLTPMEVIVAATRNAAFVCGQGETLGTLEPGKLADIIVVDGDPLTDLEAMDRVVAVVKGGEVAHAEGGVSSAPPPQQEDEISLAGAAMGGQVDVVRALLDGGADVNTASELGYTPLHNAASFGHAGVVKLLLDHGAALEAREHRGRTALWVAVRLRHPDVVRLLLERGADVNAGHDRGWTPLMLSALLGNAELATILLDYGADVNAQEENGWTALDIAGGGTEVGKLLRERIGERARSEI